MKKKKKTFQLNLEAFNIILAAACLLATLFWAYDFTMLTITMEKRFTHIASGAGIFPEEEKEKRGVDSETDSVVSAVRKRNIFTYGP